MNQQEQHRVAAADIHESVEMSSLVSVTDFLSGLGQITSIFSLILYGFPLD